MGGCSLLCLKDGQRKADEQRTSQRNDIRRDQDPAQADYSFFIVSLVSLDM
jgi:hypothetical protein